MAEEGLIAVVIVGVCLLIVNGLHKLVAGLSVASPLYVALKL